MREAWAVTRAGHLPISCEAKTGPVESRLGLLVFSQGGRSPGLWGRQLSTDS